MDGQTRFKIGLIDFLTKYTSLKLLENEIVSTIGQVDKREVSAIDFDTYQERFVEYMKKQL
tara:strand:+ start:432 stop:614 length:183 start_codon:yes stop_codon:yes gene_type:complete